MEGVGTSSSVALRGAVGAVQQPRTTTDHQQWLKLIIERDVRRGIPHTPQHLDRVGAVAHERLRRTRRAHRRLPPDQSRTPR
jgi:desulfoferrodoxin (superoxide reductase-like protein)